MRLISRKIQQNLVGGSDGKLVTTTNNVALDVTVKDIYFWLSLSLGFNRPTYSPDEPVLISQYEVPLGGE